MSATPLGFFAYASRPASLSETIRKGIELVNETGAVHIQGWQTALHPTGQFLIDDICEHINKSQIFGCDLTTLNPNVLFELGYAIVKRKRIWIVLDSSRDDAVKNYDALPLTTTVGHSRYLNATEFKDQFIKENVAETLDRTIYAVGIADSPSKPTMLYLPSAVKDQASVELSSFGLHP